jgi:hypothetical protein
MANLLKALFIFSLLSGTFSAYSMDQSHDLCKSCLFEDSVKRLRHTIGTELPSIDINMVIGSRENGSVHEYEGAKKLIISDKDALLPYLTRPFNEVAFQEDGALTWPLEKYFYAVLDTIQFFVPCRGEPSIYPALSNQYKATESRNFYCSGVDQELLDSHYKEMNLKSKFCKVLSPKDIYEIRQYLFEYELGQLTEKIETPILIVPNSNDLHGTLTFHILDIPNQRVLTSILLNSCYSEDYHKQMNAKFNMPSRYNCLVNNDEEMERIQELFPNVVNDDSLRKRYVCNWQIPFLDFSYNLQTSQDDSNCALYTYTSANALAKAFDKVEFVHNVVDLSKNVFSQPENEEMKRTLESYFKSQFFANLPQYYHPNGDKKPEQEIKQYHMKLRWDLSSAWLVEFFNNSQV